MTKIGNGIGDMKNLLDCLKNKTKNIKSQDIKGKSRKIFTCFTIHKHL